MIETGIQQQRQAFSLDDRSSTTPDNTSKVSFLNCLIFFSFHFFGFFCADFLELVVVIYFDDFSMNALLFSHWFGCSTVDCFAIS